MNSRAKGARGERMWRDELREAFGDSGIRRGQQFSGLGDSPDVVCPCLPDFHFEVKFCQVVKIRDWMAQAIRDAKAAAAYKSKKLFPVVAHKRNGEEWFITLRAQDFLTILRRSDFLVPTQNQTPAT
jgi:hypothetical protein